MSDIPFYTILDPVRWSRAASEVHGALGRRGKARNAKCLCGSGRKFKFCCGTALAGPPEDWLDAEGGLRLVAEDGLSPEMLQDIGHMAHIERARRAFEKSESLEAIPAEASSTDWAAVAGVVRLFRDEPAAERPDSRNQLQAVLRKLIAAPLDRCLDYRRITFDLVAVSVELGDVQGAVDAQRWWIDFLEDFGKAFGLRVEAIDRLHELRVMAGQAEPTEEARQALLSSYMPPASASRAALIKNTAT